MTLLSVIVSIFYNERLKLFATDGHRWTQMDTDGHRWTQIVKHILIKYILNGVADRYAKKNEGERRITCFWGGLIFF